MASTLGRQFHTTAAFLLFLFFFCHSASAVHFTMLSTYNKCIFEHLNPNTMAQVNFKVLDEKPLQVSVKVSSPNGKLLYKEEYLTSGEFGFKSEEEGDYGVCFWVTERPKEKTELSILLDWKTGVALKDYEKNAKEGGEYDVKMNLLQMKDFLEEIHETMIILRSQEEIARHWIETANSRVAWIGIASLSICLGVSGLQLWYLKSYFIRKKLL